MNEISGLAGFAGIDLSSGTGTGFGNLVKQVTSNGKQTKKAAKAARLHKDKMACNKPKKTQIIQLSHMLLKPVQTVKKKLLGLVNKVLKEQEKILNQLKIKHVGSHIMRVIMHKIVSQA